MIGAGFDRNYPTTSGNVPAVLRSLNGLHVSFGMIFIAFVAIMLWTHRKK